MMRRFVLPLVALLLTACGPDDPTPVASSTDANAMPAASSTSAAELPAPGVSASDPVANAQASLAADSQQVTPVLSRAPDAEDTAQH